MQEDVDTTKAGIKKILNRILTMICGGYMQKYIKNKKLYEVWKSMNQRCSNTNNKDYRYYGSKGITVCDYWLSYLNFELWSEKNG